MIKNDTPEMDQYQQAAFMTALPTAKNIEYMALGLASEAGEVAGKVKKAIRDNGGELTPAIRAAVLLELGDVLWYVAGICTLVNASMNDVAKANIDKLLTRQEKGTLQGSGDSR